MLSYLHGYHAGNFADVQKHLVQCRILRALQKKPKAWSYLETHSGHARYELDSEQALKTREFETGIGKLWNQSDLSPELADYCQQIRDLNPDGALSVYPGSPLLATQVGTENDIFQLMELHPTEAQTLKQLFRHDSRVHVHHRDGYEGVLGCLPPNPRRGVVLVDPSYEVKSEYQQVAQFIDKAVKRWPQGIFVVWYPLLGAGQHDGMLSRIKKFRPGPLLRCELEVKPPMSGGELGMYGSGMLIVNPPWQLDKELAPLMQELNRYLAAGKGRVKIDWLAGES